MVDEPTYRWVAKADAPTLPFCREECPSARVLVWTIRDVHVVRCHACDCYPSYALQERYRTRTRLSFGDLEPEPKSQDEDTPRRAQYVHIPRPPKVTDGRVRQGRKRAA